RLPGLVDHLDLAEGPEHPLDGVIEVLAMALLDPGTDVAGRADEQGVAGAGGELERLKPDVEGEVGDVLAKLATDFIPQVLQVLGHGLATPLRGRFRGECMVAWVPVPSPAGRTELPEALVRASL